jgi:hypothetical protein
MRVRDDGECNLFKKNALIELLSAIIEVEKHFRFQAFGFSMLPFIRNKDILTISPLSVGRPRQGDVVAFFLPGTRKLAVHRVVGKKENCYLVKGDNIPESDGLIPRACILGHVTKVERREKLISLGLGSERYLIAFLSRAGLLSPALNLVYKLVCPIFKRIRT